MKELDKKLLQLFLEAEKDILLKVETALKQWKQITSYKAVLADIQNILQNLWVNITTWANIRLPESYLEGVNLVDKSSEITDFLKEEHTKDEYVNFIWNYLGQIHLEAVENLISEGIAYASNIVDWVYRGARWSLAKWNEVAILEKLAKWEIEGESLQELKQEVIKTLKEKGLTIMKDRGWKSWSLSRYWEVVVRSETAKASNAGTINRGVEVWITKFKRVEKFDCCEICALHNGEIWDVAKQGQPPLIYHSNCRWYWIPVFD